MKKRFMSLALLAVLGCSIGLTGCGGSDYSIEITNKEELLEEWHLGDNTRTLELDIEYKGETQNAVAAIAAGELVISSSDTSVISTSGAVLAAVGEGEATITANYNGVKDSVDFTILPEREVEADWEVGGTYVFGFEYNGIAYYADGNLVSGYDYEGSLTTNLDDAVHVTVEEGDGGHGFYLTFEKNSTKYYICIITLNGYQDLQYTTTPNLIYWDTLNQVWTNEADTYFLAYNSSYNCILASSISSWLGSAPALALYPLTGIPDAGTGGSKSYGTVEVSQYESGESYLLGIQTATDRYYATGAMSGYYGATTSDYSNGLYFTITNVDGGVTLSATISGTTKYVTMEVNDGHDNLVYSETSQTLNYDETYNTFTYGEGDDKVFLGSYGSNSTLGWSKYSYLPGSTEYPSHLYELGDDSEDNNLPDPADWSVGNQYALGYAKNGVMYYYNGQVLKDYYGDVSTYLSAAAKVTVETCNEGYSLKLENGKYLGFSYSHNERGDQYNFEWNHDEAYEWGYDQDLNTFTAVYNETTYVMGTTNSYNEITMVQPTSSNYIARLYDLA